MAIKYCAVKGCGAKNEYSGAIQPKFCNSCGNPFAQAFASIKIESNTTQSLAKEPTTPKVFANQMIKRPVESRAPWKNVEEVENDELEPEINEYEVGARTRELANQLKASDFIVQTEKTSVKFTDVVQIPKNGG